MAEPIWATCQRCGAELNPKDDKCPKCVGATNKHFERGMSTSIGMVTEIKWSVRTLFEKVLYDLARQHANDAESAFAVRKHNDEMVHSIQAVVFAAACLEAFINQIGIDKLEAKFDAYDAGKVDAKGNNLATRHHPSVEDKWCDMTQLICGKQFDKGKSPFQGFHGLLALRQYILHYKAMSSEGFPSPWQDMNGFVPEERAKLTASAARSAVQSMEGMLKEFHILISAQLPDWLTA